MKDFVKRIVLRKSKTEGVTWVDLAFGCGDKEFFKINSIKLVKLDNGEYYIYMPRRKKEFDNGKILHMDIGHPLGENSRTILKDIIVEEFNKQSNKKEI